jgi:hypothetical protein
MLHQANPMKSRPFPLSLILLLCLSPCLYAQNWSGILSSQRAMDWSKAGAAHINDTRIQCTTSSCQALCVAGNFPACTSAQNNSATAINNALASAPANSYVLLPPTSGTDSISGVIKFPEGGSGNSNCTSNCSNITLRGAGANSTIFSTSGGTCTDGGNTAICMESADVNYMGGPSNTASWTAGYSKGATTITLTSVSNLKVGSPIVLDQLDDSSDSGGLWVDCENSTLCGKDGPSGFQRSGRGQFQMVNVASCTTSSGTGDITFGHACTSGTNITISPGLYAPNWRSSQSPGVWWSSSPIFNDGVENLSATYNGVGITIFNCTGCWVKGVRGVRTSTTSTGWFHASAYISNHSTIRDSYFYGYPGDSYAVGPQVASDLLIENNIFQFPSGVVYNSDCEGCVLGYNFQVNAGANATQFLSQSNWFHSNVLYALDEGNIGGGLYADYFHGNHSMNTAFRNRWQGIGVDSNGSLTSSNNYAIELTYGTRYHSFVGNVLGMPGYHNGYQAGGNPVISVDTSDASMLPSTMFWGNWDAPTNAVRWCTASGAPISSCTRDERAGGAATYPGLSSPSTTLPASFYYASTPSWWPSGKAWPIIGPGVTGGNVGYCGSGTYKYSDVITSVSNICGSGVTPSSLAGGLVTSNPAMDCYFNQMGGNANGTGSALTFDADACYPNAGGGGGSGGGGTTPPDPPTALTAVAQ